MVARGEDRPVADRASAVAARSAQWRRRDGPWRPMTRLRDRSKWGAVSEPRLGGCGQFGTNHGRWTDHPMTPIRQIEANRRNALRSTGPITVEGKDRSRRNAIRHGLRAETVVEIVEDVHDYRGFEAAVIADYDARTAVERELVLRLASLLGDC